MTTSARDEDRSTSPNQSTDASVTERTTAEPAKPRDSTVDLPGNGGPSGRELSVALDRFDADKPVTEWTYAEWEAYRLRCENEELRSQLAEMTGPKEAQLHALRWALIVGAVGVEFVLAIALSGIVSLALWTIFAAHILGLITYGFTMDEYRSAAAKQRKKSAG